ncbi:MAG TPA: NAD(P)H:quinone oxidoreductase [Desulfobaccales bacterium]
MKVLVVYYSMYGHVLQLAHSVVEGVKSVAGVEVVLRRVQEFAEIEADIPRHEHALAVWNRQKDIPVCTLDDLKEAEGFVFGSPTRYGNMTAQMKRLFDTTVKLWLAGGFEGKPAGVFTSTASTHGGQETTCFTMMAPLLHLGMIIVGVPYSTPGLLHYEARGGSPYGASTIAGGQNELQPAPEDLAIAQALGRRVAEVTRKLRG